MESVRTTDELATGASSTRTLHRTLENLYRRSVADYQERGLRVLHLAVGTLHWTEQRDEVGAEVVESPLILIPVELERDGIGKPFFLRLSDEEPVVNPTLAVKLNKDFGVSLPDIEGSLEADDDDDYDLSSFFEQVEGLSPDFRVESTCHLGLFTFHKEVLYRDLAANWETALENDLVGALARGETLFGDNDSIPTEADVDRLQVPSETITVLDADASQRICLQHARDGKSFVIEGPPGTGKSQTIANLIAQSIADGKSVLFVSEKMAALEVVFNRLKQSGLSEFCLELHSHKANKKAVAKALGAALTNQVEQRRQMTSTELSRLEGLRDQLNDYVDALHEQREPLGQTAYQVLGTLAKLADAPELAGPLVSCHSATATDHRGVIELAGVLERRWEIAEEGEDFPWRGLKVRDWSAGDAQRLSDQLRELWEAHTELNRLAAEFSDAVKIGMPSRSDGVGRLSALALLLEEAKPIQPGWLMSEDLTALDQRIDHWSGRAAALKSALNSVAAYTSEPTQGEIAELRAQHSWLHGFVPNHESAVSSPAVLGAASAAAHDAGEALKHLGVVVAALGVPLEGLRLGDVDRLVASARILAARVRPDARWFSATRLSEARAFANAHRPTFERAKELSEKLESRYTEAFSEQAAELALRFKADEQRFLAGVRGQHRQDKASLRALCRSGQLPESLDRDLDMAVEVVELRKKIAAIDQAARGVLGSFYAGSDTDWAALATALDAGEELLAVTADPAVLARSLAEELPLEFHAAIDASEVSVAAVRAAVGSHADVFVPAGESLSAIAEWMAELLAGSAAFADARASYAAHRTGEATVETLLAEAECWDEVTAIRGEFDEAREELAARFPHWDVSAAGEWSAIGSAAGWARRTRTTVGELALSTAEHIASPDFDAPLATAIVSAWEAWLAVRASFLSRFDGTGLSRWNDALDGPWDAALDLIESVTGRHEDVTAWIDYARAFDELEKIEWSDFARRLEQGRISREHVRPAFGRAFFAGWIESVFQSDERLKPFRGQDHEQKIKEFVDLDLKLITHSRERVIAACNRRRPRNALHGSQVATVIREAGKQKKHMPVRKLVAAIPQLLPDLKPCLMMSPLSVSQFLPPSMRFDITIFDEASQVTVEDAICALYRADNAIIAGDPKQLPPTSFFQVGEDDDGDEDEEDSAASWESILDRSQSAGLHFQQLRWHYRSRHESLIAFSNHYFYDDNLVTFPSSWDENPGLGVELDFVENGVYDRGGSRTNKVEAARVAEIVFDLFQRCPNKSIGVVTFSNPQMTAVQDEIDAYRMKHRSFEQRFDDDRLDGFFVKNLENVQGDERDIMVFSIGYGFDASRRFSTNFGPLNKEKGERRLNVAVTRAREKVIVVSSIRATDFPIGADLRPGVLQLRNYLDFAERGAEAVLGETRKIGDDYDSDFEQAVAAELRSQGYEVRSQIGVGSFRIDLGIIDLSNPGRFLVGVECDGRRYHSTFTARDRDRLRQDVLQDNLGWQIVRVWSPDWFYRRNHAIEKLHSDIERVKKGKKPAFARRVEQDEREVEQVEISDGGVTDLPNVETYRCTHLDASSHRHIPFHEPSARSIQVRLLGELVQAEQPVTIAYARKRLKEAWGVGREGHHIATALDRAIAQAKRNKAVEQVGQSLFIMGDAPVATVIRRPDESDERTQRKLESEVPVEEIELALCTITAHSYGIATADLIRQTARVFGYDRTGNVAAEAIQSVVDHLLAAGALKEAEVGITTGTAD